jgi:hypothetical protein
MLAGRADLRKGRRVRRTEYDRTRIVAHHSQLASATPTCSGDNLGPHLPLEMATRTACERQGACGRVAVDSVHAGSASRRMNDVVTGVWVGSTRCSSC